MCPWPGQVDGEGDDSSPSKREMVRLLYQGFEEVSSACLSMRACVHVRVCVRVGVGDITHWY